MLFCKLKRPKYPHFVTFAALFGLLFGLREVTAGTVRTLRLNQNSVGKIFIAPGRSTVLSFPTKPTKVILGSQGLFGIEYIESDLAVAALSSHSQSDLFVYLDGRRFAFDLVTVSTGSDTIVLVRDASESPEEPTKKPTKATRKTSHGR